MPLPSDDPAGDSGEAWGFATPPFRPTDAREQIRRAMRDLRLSERTGGFERSGRRIAELEVGEATLSVRLARKPAITPEWDRATLSTSAQVRQWIDEVRRRLQRWDDDD